MRKVNSVPRWKSGAACQMGACQQKLRGVYYPVSIALVVGLMMESVPLALAQPDLYPPPSFSQPLNSSPSREAESQLPTRMPASQPDDGDTQPIDLLNAYERMLLNDPQVHAARAARDADLDAKNIARAALLPRISINYLRNQTRQKEYISQGEQKLYIEDSYYGHRASLTIEQSLFDYSAISTYRMGKTQAEQAEVLYRLQFQQEAVALIDAYLNALLARDSLELARQQLHVYQDLLRDNKRMMTAGEGTRIDILETRTELSATQSELLTYKNALADRLRELAALVGGLVQARQLLAIDLGSALPLPQDDLVTLVADALQQNPEVQAARLAVRYNDLTIEREKGQFMPRVSIYATHDRVDSDTINNQGRDFNTNTVGLQVSIPLFSGGSSYYTTRQAYNRREQARHELQRSSDSTRTLLEQYYRVSATSGERVRTLRQNVSDAFALIEAMRKSVAGGERTNTDALHAERQAYQARQELLRTYVEWFQAWAKLQFYAGRFSEDDVLLLNRQLVAHAQ